MSSQGQSSGKGGYGQQPSYSSGPGYGNGYQQQNPFQQGSFFGVGGSARPQFGPAPYSPPSFFQNGGLGAGSIGAQNPLGRTMDTNGMLYPGGSPGGPIGQSGTFGAAPGNPGPQTFSNGAYGSPPPQAPQATQQSSFNTMYQNAGTLPQGVSAFGGQPGTMPMDPMTRRLLGY